MEFENKQLRKQLGLWTTGAVGPSKRSSINRTLVVRRDVANLYTSGCTKWRFINGCGPGDDMVGEFDYTST